MDKNRKLLEHMAGFCETAFKTTGEILPMWLLQDEDGMIQPIVTPFDGTESKDECAQFIGLAIAGHKAVRYGFMAEAWMLSVDKDHPDFNRAQHMQPSQHRDRREIIKLLVEDKDGGMLIGHFFILRPENGPAKLSPLKIDDKFDTAKGRFSGLFKKIAG